MTIVYAEDFIVEGKPSEPITPNFTVREFTTGRGLYIHRELVGALQEMRDAALVPIRVQGLQPRAGRGKGARGCFAFVTSADPAALLEIAQTLIRKKFIARAEALGRDVYVEIPDPSVPWPLEADLALERAVRVTAAYETSGDPFQQVTGNFDGAGFSFGPLQVNFRSGTLPQLFRRYEMADANALRACFPSPAHWKEWQRVLSAKPAAQLRWADERSKGARKAEVAEPWKSCLQAVGRVEAFRTATLDYAYDVYGRKLIVALSWLHGLWRGRIDNFACLCALYDLCVQQGSLNKAHQAIRARVERERPMSQFDVVQIAVEERALRANAAWRADCLSRRLSILHREPVTITEAGKTVTRTNLRSYLIRNAPVKGAEKYLT
ncbi:MAG: hypothetical protein WD928_05655 [Gammaproteobacteria bacterium]